MRSIHIIFLSQLILLISTQNIVYTSSVVLISPQLGITNIIGNYIFYEPNGILNSLTQTLVSWPVGNCTSQGPTIDENNLIWCLACNPTTGKYTINLLSSTSLAVEAAYPIQLPANAANNLVSAGDFLIPANLSATGSTSQPYQHMAISPFNSSTHQVSCSNLTVNFTDTESYFPIYYLGNAYLYIVSNTISHPYAIYQTCNNTISIGPLAFAYQVLDLWALNDSTIFLHQYYKDESDPQVYAIPWTANSDGQFEFGSDNHGFGFYKVNDTNFIMPEFSSKNNTDFQLWAVDDGLNWIELSEYHSGVPGIPTDVTVLPGTLNAAFTFEDGQFLFDIETGDAISVTGMLPPITISGGMVVNITTAGVFYQDQTESHPHFLPLPWNSMYQDPSDPEHIFVMNIPTALGSLSENCSLIEINPQNTEVVQTYFANCPLINNSTYVIKDVNIDSKGNPIVAYRDQLFNLYIVTSSKNFGPYITTSLYTFPMISINYNAGTGIFVGAQVVPPNFVIGSFSLSTGNVSSKILTNNAGILNYVCKLNEQYVMLSATTTGKTTFSVWNLQTNTMVYNFTSSVPMPISKQTPFFAIDVNPLNNTQTIISGLVIINSGNTLPYLVNTQGAYVQVSLSGSLNNLEVYGNGPNSIFLSYTNNYLVYGTVIQISNWTLLSQENIIV
jgi:hypothetical protein